MSKTSVPAGLLALGCLWALPGPAHAQTTRDAQPSPDVAVETQQQVTRVSSLSSSDTLAASSPLRGSWAVPLAPGASSTSALLADGALLRPRARRRSSDRVLVLLSWAYTPSKLSFSETQTFTKYVEDTGRLDLNYSQPAHSGFSVDGRMALWRGLALQLGYSGMSRRGSVQATAEIPDPFYFERNRSVAHAATGFVWREGTVHIDAAYGRHFGPVRAAVFAGVGLLFVNADIAGELAYTQVYPYASENVTVTALRSQRVSGHALGPDAGVALDLPLAGHLGLGALVRYSGARITLARPMTPAPLDNGAATGEQVVQTTPGSSVDVDARGLQVAAGVRLFF